MGGFPFMAIGAGLGQGAQQINQGNESQIRQAMARLAQQQAMREMAAKGLMGEALMAGDIPGLSGGGGMGGFGGGAGGLNLPGTTRLPGAPGSMPAYSTLPDGTMDPRGASPPFMGNQPGGNTSAPISQFTEQPPPMSGPAMAPPSADAARGPLYVPPEQDDGTPVGYAPIPLDGPAASSALGLPPGGMLMSDEQYRGWNDALNKKQRETASTPRAEPSAAEMARAEPQISYDASPAQAAPGAAPEAGSAAGSADAAPAQQAAPATPQEIPAYLSMFQHVDPTAIAARIKAIRPDADPAAVAMATESLYKMAQGGLKEQTASASMMKFLIGNQTKQQIAGKVSEDKGKAIDARATQGALNRDVRVSEGALSRDTRVSEGAKTREAAMARTQARIMAAADKAAAAAPDKADQQAFREMSGRVRQLKSRIDAIDMGPVNAATKQEREKLSRQMEQMTNILAKRLEAKGLMPPAQPGE